MKKDTQTSLLLLRSYDLHRKTTESDQSLILPLGGLSGYRVTPESSLHAEGDGPARGFTGASPTFALERSLRDPAGNQLASKGVFVIEITNSTLWEGRMKRTTYLSLMLWTLACTALGGCGVSRDLHLTPADDGRQIQIRPGQELIITLESNPTTGYSWQVRQLDERVIQQLGEAAFQEDSALLGAGGVEVLTFRALQGGETSLELVYQRPWEKEEEPLETFHIQVVVE
jgi:inhibitor of cysteine peptidase